MLMAPNFRTPEYHRQRGAAGIREGEMPDLTESAAHGDIARGIVAYGIPFGDDAFIKSFLTKKANEIVGDLATIGERMSPHVIAAPEFLSRQCLWQLVLFCLQDKGNY